MKNVAALGILLMAILASADTLGVSNGTMLNLQSLQIKQIPTYSLPCSHDSDTLNRYDFFYQYFDYCTCICSCCPVIQIASPRPFYFSKAPMNYTSFRPNLLSVSFTKISGPDKISKPLPCSTFSSISFGRTGNLNSIPIDSIRSRLFVFLSNNGGNLPYYRFMLVQINPIPRQEYCNENFPYPGPGQYYSIYDSARISIYKGERVSTIPTERSLSPQTGFKETDIFTVFGKRIQTSQREGLPAGIYVVSGRLRFLQKNKRNFGNLNSR